jgi:hypothetical protein
MSSWKDLLWKNPDRLCLPWVGGRFFHLGPRTYRLEGDFPTEHGWAWFDSSGVRNVVFAEMAEEPPTDIIPIVVDSGFVVGDRLVSDRCGRVDDIKGAVFTLPKVHLLPLGLDRFVRISAMKLAETGPWLFQDRAFPLGPEGDVIEAYEASVVSLNAIPNVTPALDAAFHFECWMREERERRREALRKLAEEEARQKALAEKRKKVAEALGDGETRRALAHEDFGEGARAALAVGGATYLDHRASHRRNEMVVKFRFLHRRFECVVDRYTLRVIDSGVCLTDHNTGIKGDTRFTLESLPAVLAEAHRENRLVVLRHAD